MQKTTLFSTLIIMITLLSACSPAEVVVEETLLTAGGNAYTQSELDAFGTISVDYTNKDGETTNHSGVSLVILLEDAGLTESGETLVFTAADGYQAEMPLDEALSCPDCILAFDNGSLRMVMPGLSSKLQVRDIIEISVN